jgi:hypothetical protein
MERSAGVEPATSLWKSDVWPPTLRSRRPCESRTRHLLAENQVSYRLLQRSMEPGTAGLPALGLPNPDVSRPGIEPGTSRVSTGRSHLRSLRDMNPGLTGGALQPELPGPKPGAGLEPATPADVRPGVGYRGVEPRNSWSQTRRPTVGPVSDMAGDHPEGTPPAVVMPSTVEFSTHDPAPAGHAPEGQTHGWKDSNPREPLWRRSCSPLHHTRMNLSLQRKTARSLIGAGGAWSVLRYRCHPWCCPCFASGRMDVHSGMPNSESRLTAFAVVACHKLDTG